MSAADLSARFAAAFALQREGRFHKAAQAYGALSQEAPRDPAILNNLGNCLRSLGRDADAVPCFERAIALDPGRASSRLNLALARLALGDYADAWPDYEARLETIEFRRDLLAERDRQWKGEVLEPGEPLYLFGNQGLGDELQCLRFLPEVARRAGKVVLELQAPLISLAGGLPEPFIVIQRGDPVPPFARWCELFSLPGIFGVERNDLPPSPALRFDRNPEVLTHLEKERCVWPDHLHVGLVWSGNPANDLNRFRACGLGHLLPLLELEGFRFHSLQKGAPSSDIGSLGVGESLSDLAPLLGDLAATATAMEALDLVVTTDTSVPHLAGVLGIPAWVLLHRPADWRWGHEGDSTPWYPSLRLFRQKKMRDWAPVVALVAEELRSFREKGNN